MKIKNLFRNKIFILITFSSLFLFLALDSINTSNFITYKKEEKVTSEILPTEANTLTLHFTADGRLPYDWYADWIVFDAFIRGVYSTLTYLTPNGLFDIENEDSLLDFIERENSDPKKLIFRIKKGQYFEKNTEKHEFTAEDLKFSYSIPFFLNEEDIIEKSDLLKIKGMDKIIPGETYSEEKVTGITILDKYTLKIELIHPDPDIITNLSTSKYPIVSKYFYQKKIKGEITPGLGKYKLVSSNKSTGEALLKRKKHVDGYPDFVKFISTSNITGDVFWKDQWGKTIDPYYKEIISVPYGTLGIFFNYETELGKNKFFRSAINLALNRSELCEGFPYLVPNSQVLPNGYWGRIKKEESQNILLSKKLILNLKNIIPDPFIIKISQSSTELEKPYFQKLKNQLISIGINPVFIRHEGNKKLDSIIAIHGIAVPYKNPISVFQFFVDGSFYSNAYPKNNDTIKYLFNKLNTSFKDSERLYYAKELSLYLHENNVFVPLWDLLSVYIVNKERIETLGDQPGGMVFDIWKVKLKNEN